MIHCVLIIRDSESLIPKKIKVGCFKFDQLLSYSVAEWKLIEKNWPDKVKPVQGHAHFQVEDSILSRYNPVKDVVH